MFEEAFSWKFMQTRKPGILALEDGTILRGHAFGAATNVVGEAVFNTSMTGYQEILTDPSYSGQIVTMTVPHIGNYGVHQDDEESDRVQASGLIIHELSPIVSNWRAQGSLPEYMEAHGIPGLSGVDTRALTKKLRTGGVLKACLSTDGLSDEDALARARAWEGLSGHDYVADVSCKKPYFFNEQGFASEPFTVEGTVLKPAGQDRPRFRIAALDFGSKRSIFRKLAYYGFDVHVFPANSPIETIQELKPQGIFLSNGPGDPAILKDIHQTVAKLIEHYPTFGICLGHQIISHALGAETYKLKFGHHGGNHPVKSLETGLVKITAQNHGYASTEEDLKQRGAEVTEINMTDNSVEGLRHKELPLFAVQYHPEAAPGPNDADPLFDDFYQLVAKHA